MRRSELATSIGEMRNAYKVLDPVAVAFETRVGQMMTTFS